VPTRSYHTLVGHPLLEYYRTENGSSRQVPSLTQKSPEVEEALPKVEVSEALSPTARATPDQKVSEAGIAPADQKGEQSDPDENIVADQKA
jgi:hypothetical protein